MPRSLKRAATATPPRASSTPRRQGYDPGPGDAARPLRPEADVHAAEIRLERGRHAALAPHKQQALYHRLTSQLPERERALVGRDHILDFLTTELAAGRDDDDIPF